MKAEMRSGYLRFATSRLQALTCPIPLEESKWMAGEHLAPQDLWLVSSSAFKIVVMTYAFSTSSHELVIRVSYWTNARILGRTSRWLWQMRKIWSTIFGVSYCISALGDNFENRKDYQACVSWNCEMSVQKTWRGVRCSSPGFECWDTVTVVFTVVVKEEVCWERNLRRNTKS